MRLIAQGNPRVQGFVAGVVAVRVQVVHIAGAGRQGHTAAHEQVCRQGQVANQAQIVGPVVADPEPKPGHGVFIRFSGHDIQRATAGIAAEIGALRTAQNLDPCDVVKRWIRAAAGHERRTETVYEIADRGARLNDPLVAAGGQITQAANGNIAVLIALLVIGCERDVGGQRQEISRAAIIALLQLRAAERRNTDRHVEGGLLATLCGHGNLFKHTVSLTAFTLRLRQRHWQQYSRQYDRQYGKHRIEKSARSVHDPSPGGGPSTSRQITAKHGAEPCYRRLISLYINLW